MLSQDSSILGDWTVSKVERHQKRAVGKTAQSRKNMKEFVESKNSLQALALAFADNPCDSTFYPLEKKIRWSLRSRIMNMVKDDSETSEVYDRVLLKIYYNIGKYDKTKGTFHTWANQIAKNITINYIEECSAKKSVSLNTVSLSSIPESELCQPDDIIDIVYDGSKYEVYTSTRVVDEMFEASCDYIASARDDASVVFTERYIQHKKMKEICESTGKPLNTVKNILHRGKTVIKKEVIKNNRDLYEMYMDPDIA